MRLQCTFSCTASVITALTLAALSVACSSSGELAKNSADAASEQDADGTVKEPGLDAGANPLPDGAAADAASTNMDGGADADPLGMCTADMRASIKTSCGGVASGAYYTGLLDFACADTTASAPDSATKIDAFCKSHKVGDTVYAVLSDAGVGFWCYCFVA